MNIYGKRFCWNQGIYLKPHLGLKGAVIHQNQNIVCDGVRDNNKVDPVAVTIDRKNNFLAIGPRVGIDSLWSITRCLSFIGNISGSLLYGHFDFEDHLFFNEPAPAPEPFVNSPLITQKIDRLRPTVQCLLGLGWGDHFCNSYYMEFGIAYEVQYFWHQWQHTTSIATSLAGAQSSADLTLHGLTARYRIDF